MMEILLIDDEILFLNILKRELEYKGYKVIAESSSEKALEIIKTKIFSIIIMDINMPKKTGYDLLHEIRVNNINSNVILVTAFASIEGAVKGMQMGANDYLQKPFDTQILIDKIDQLSKSKSINKATSDTIEKDSIEFIPSNSSLMHHVESIVKKVRDTETTVLITGENGCGKGVTAKMIHYTSNRAEKPFIQVDCASLPESLIESELFGYEKGAFTGADKLQQGKFELADGGTIFLDEIGVLPLRLQTKLLIVLQEKNIFRLGGTKRVKINVRVIAATNENLEESVRTGSFRQDLYYRLNVVRIELPPLRFRREDIIPIAKEILSRKALSLGINISEIENGFFEALLAYDWPGNLRELENAIESALILCNSESLNISDLPLRISSNTSKYSNIFNTQNISSIGNIVNSSEKLEIIRALEQCNYNRENTAKYLGISRRTLQYKLKKYELSEYRAHS